MKISGISVKENYGTKYEVSMSIEGTSPQEIFALMTKITAESEFFGDD